MNSNESISPKRSRGIDQIPVCETCAGLLDAVLGVTSRIPDEGSQGETRCALCGRPASVRARSRDIAPVASAQPGELEVVVTDHLVRLTISGDIVSDTVGSVVNALAAAHKSGHAVLIDLLNVRLRSSRSIRALVERLVDEPGGPMGLVVRLGQLPGRAQARALAAGWLVTDSYESAERELGRMVAEKELRAPGD